MDFRSLFADLRRRHVTRVAWLYAVGAFVVLQAAELLFPPLGVPDWAFRTLVISALIGFPLAMVLAWAYDITPAGVKRTRPAGEPEEEAAAPAPLPPSGRFDPRKLAYVGLGMVVALAAFGLGAPYLRSMGGPDGGSGIAVADRDRSIVVLPFTSLSTDREDQVFTDGLTDDILSALSNTPGLHVVSRTTALGYRNTTKSIREIGRELGVGTVLEGSVRRDGNLVRITVSLVDTRSDENLWAETFDRELADGFGVQTEVAQHIAAALQGRLSPEDEAAAERRLTAYYYSAKARDYLARGGPQHNETAVALFHQALEIDSASTPALAGLADAYVLRTATADVRWLDSAEVAVRAALAGNVQLAAPHAASGRVLLARGRPTEAAAAFEEAVRLDGKDPAHLLGLARAQRELGRVDLALGAAARATALAPDDGRNSALLAELALTGGDTARARRAAEAALAAPRPAPIARRTLALLDARAGRTVAAREHVEHLLEEGGHDLAVIRAAGELELLLSHEAASRAHLEAVLAAVPNGTVRPTTELAVVYRRAGRLGAADSLLDESVRRIQRRIDQGDLSGGTRYELARALAARGDREGALALLEEAAIRGYHDPVGLELDPAFETLRSHPRFRALAGRMEGGKK